MFSKEIFYNYNEGIQIILFFNLITTSYSTILNYHIIIAVSDPADTRIYSPDCKVAKFTS